MAATGQVKTASAGQVSLSSLGLALLASCRRRFWGALASEVERLDSSAEQQRQKVRQHR